MPRPSHRRPVPPRLASALTVLLVLLIGPPGAAAPPAPDGAWPLDPRPAVVGGFHPPADPWGRGHRGVDLAGRVGQPVRAALAGTVTVASVIAGRGVLVVDHGPTRTTYEPVAVLVTVGTTVERGEVVARLEGVGSHCSPATCLHWGWRRGDTYLDPLDLVGSGPVRLLPLVGQGGAAAGAPGAGPAPPTRRAGGRAPTAPVAASAHAAGAARTVVAALTGLVRQGLLPCPGQARGWACR